MNVNPLQLKMLWEAYTLYRPFFLCFYIDFTVVWLQILQKRDRIKL